MSHSLSKAILLALIASPAAAGTCGFLPGGDTTCIDDPRPEVDSKWYLSVCPNVNPQAKIAIMCEAAGGQWVTDPQPSRCDGLPDPPYVDSLVTVWRTDQSDSLLYGYILKQSSYCEDATVSDVSSAFCGSPPGPVTVGGLVVGYAWHKRASWKKWDFNHSCSPPDPIRREDDFRLFNESPVACPVSHFPVTSIQQTGAQKTCGAITSDICAEGNPVDPGSGEKLHTESTLMGTSFSSLLQLHYRSFGSWGSPGTEGIVGRYTRFGFDRRISIYDANSVTLHTAGRAPLMFRKDAFGVYQPIHVARGSTQTVTAIPLGFRLKDTDLSEWEFDLSGRLTAILYPDSRSLDLAWSGDNVTLTNETGRSVHIQVSQNIAPGAMTGPPVLGKKFDISDGSGAPVTVRTIWPGVVASIQDPSGTKTFLYENTSFPSGLTGIKDALGVQTHKYTYDANSRVFEEFIRPQGADLRQFTFNYGYTSFEDTAGSVTITNQLGKTSTMYTTVIGGVRRLDHQTENCSNCGGGTTMNNYYNPDGTLTAKIDLNGVRTEFLWNSRKLETQRIEAKSAPGVANPTSKRTIQTDWHPTLSVPTEKRYYNAQNVLEQSRAWTYDTLGNVKAACVYDPALSSPGAYTCGSQFDAPIGVRQTRYHIECKTGPQGNCVSTGRLLSVDGPRTDVADTTTLSYYETDDPSCATPQGACEYRSGDLQTTTNALGHITEYVSYDKAGRLTRVRAANGLLTDYAYDARGRIEQTIVRANADGSPSTDDLVTSVIYEAYGDVKRVTQPDGSYLEYVRDAAHRLTGVIDNLGNQITYTLDEAGNRKREATRDAQNNIKRLLISQYDVFSRVRSQINARFANVDEQLLDTINEKTKLYYDMNGNLDELVDPLGRATDYDYDELNRVNKVIGDKAVGGINATTLTAYDTRDNVRKVTDPKGLETIYTYDGLDNLTQLQSPDTGTTVYTHDAAGNVLTQMDARLVTATITYDELGRVTSRSFPDASLNETYLYDIDPGDCKYGSSIATGLLSMVTDGSGTTTYCYDSFGRVASKTQIGPTATYTTSYTYTNAGRLETVTYPSGNRVRYERDATGRVTTVYWQEFKSDEQVLVSNVSYLPFGPVSAITWDTGLTQTRAHDQNYWIDEISSSFPTGLQADFTLDDVGNITNIASGSVQRVYEYDALNRLAHQKNSGVNIRNYEYDATGNRLSFSTDELGSTQNYGYPATSHRLETVGSATRVYDANGNLTHPTYQVLSGRTYSYGDHNRMTEVAVNGQTKATFRYNFKGERTVKDRAIEANRIYDFVFDESGRLIGEYTDQAASALAEYVWIDDLPVSVIYDSKIYAIEADHLGTPRRVVNATQAKWSWDLLAEPFGDTAPNEDPDGDGGALVFNLRFPGQYYDQDTKLNYNYFRDFEPGTGRYVESDPIGLRGGAGTYVYAASNPLRSLDFFGQKPGDKFKSVGDALKDLRKFARTLKPDYIEWGGWIFPVGDGDCVTYNYTTSNLPGKVLYEDLVKIKPAKVKATWHTHTFRNKNSNPALPENQLSGEPGGNSGDRGFAEHFGVPNYLIAPDSSIPGYDPNTDKDLPPIEEGDPCMCEN